MGFVEYFLITWDFVNYAREQGIPVGPGRGSAAGSIVSYALGITSVDPLEYDLELVLDEQHDVLHAPQERHGLEHFLQVLRIHCENIAVEDGQIGQLARCDRALGRFLAAGDGRRRREAVDCFRDG